MSDTSSSAKHEWVRRVLDVAVGSDGAPLAGVVAYRKALLGLGAARQRATAEVRDLADQLAEKLPERAELAERVADRIEEFCDEIGDTIDRGINAAEGERGETNAEVKREVLALIGRVSGDKLIAHVDANPLKSLHIAADLSAALQRVADTVV